jgi:hypothetical protein
MNPARDLCLANPLTLVVGAASVAFLGLGLRTFLAPEAAAAFFGAPATAPEALVFVKAYGARNIAIALTALALIALDLRRGLGALLVCAAVVAALDALNMYGFSGWGGAAKHMGYVVGLGGLAAAVLLLGPRRASS